MALFEGLVPAVAQSLEKRGLVGKCAVCGTKGRQMIHPAPAAIPIYEADGDLKVPGTSMPTAIVVCDNCGAVQLFSMGALGLMGNKAGATDPSGQPDADSDGDGPVKSEI